MARYLLSDLVIRGARVKTTPYRLNDGDGLTLRVAPSGVKSWQFRYALDGKEQTATLGKLADMTLAEARKQAEAARNKVRDGLHVTVEQRVTKAKHAAAREHTFESVAKAWVEVQARRKRWHSDYVVEVTNSIANHLAKLNGLPLHEIRAVICAPLLAKLERNAPNMERKVRQRLNGILDFGVERGYIDINPLPAAHGARIEIEHLPALLSHQDVGAILRAADAAEVSRGVRRAHLLAAFTAQRSGEVAPAEWSEFDLDAGTWSIPRDRMKRKAADRGVHLVPVPPRLLEQLREWRRTDGQNARYVCPAPRDEGPIHPEAVTKFYSRGLSLKGRHVPHGWRSVLKSWAADAGKDADAVEAQLDHKIGTATQAAYDRAKRLERRRKLMTWHEASLLAARDGAAIIPLAKVAR